MTSLLATRFFERFAGLTRAHGRYAIGGALVADKKGKLTGPRKTLHEPYTAELWDGHLAGKFGIGVVPIREDSSCRFGAGDIDIYQDFDLKALNARVQRLELPLIVCRTKSGGAHLYLFTTAAVPAEIIRRKIMEWMIVLGHAGVEVFPKQTRLASATDPVEDSTGNWINMPYAGGENSLRYALDPTTGDALSPEAFLDLADKLALPDADALEATQPVEDAVADNLWLGAPPCLKTLAVRGFGDWDNDGLFNIAVYLRRRYGDDWADHLDLYNQQFLDNPLSSKDMGSVVKSVSKKAYSYKCRAEPICGVCNKQVCRDQEFGVGGLPDDPGVIFGSMIKLMTEPPTWILEVNGARLEVDTATLMDQRRFQSRVIEVLSMWPVLIKPGTWQKIMRERLAEVETVEVPEDATREGQLWVHLSRFCTSRVSGKAMDEILMGKPYTDEAEQRTYFQAADFIQYLQQHRVAQITEREIWRWLRRCGAEHSFKTLKGKGVNLWSVPAFSKQTEEHGIPKVPTTGEM